MVEHVLIPDADRHEPKHASTAIAGQVLKAVAADVTTFGFVDYTEVANRPASFGYIPVLTGQSSSASQQPSAVNTPLQVEFGAAQTTTDVSISATGLVTFNTTGQYNVTLFLRFGRTTAAGDAYLFNRILINGTQSLNSNALRLGSQEIVVPFSATIPFDVTAGTTFALQIMRDGTGVNNGGLFQLSPTLSGWATAPSATILVSKFKGLA